MLHQKKNNKTMAAGNISADKVKFVQDYWQYAVKAGAKYGHDPAFILAHAVAERGWKGSKMSDKVNNFFGITAGSSWKGEKYYASTKLVFRAYPTLQASFDDYVRLIYEEKYYKNVRKQGIIEEFAYDISRSAYISEGNGDNREVYRNNILSAYYTIIKIAKPNAVNWLLVSVLGLAAVGGAAWYVWKYEPKTVQKVRLLLTT